MSKTAVSSASDDSPPATAVPGVAVRKAGRSGPEHARVLTPDALDFVAGLARKFEPRRQEILRQRRERQTRFDAGEMPNFLPETRDIRDREWTIAPAPKDLCDRRVEITGPPDRKMIINALNSGASVFMTDFEDAQSPTWDNMIQGQINLRDLWDGSIDFTDPGSGKAYALGPSPATLIVRPRGWHLDEIHAQVDGAPISGSLFDFGLYLFHNARKLLDRGTGPYFYLPKLEGRLEARLWNDVFSHAEAVLGLPAGCCRATVLIETLPAAFEMDEILYELRDHIVGLNCGRWDYIFSYIKRLGRNPQTILPDRAQVTMDHAFLKAYSLLLIKTCHRRGAHAMGGMAAQIPVKNDPDANDAAFAKVRADKEREARDGHDGTWVAHPGLVPVAMEVFDAAMPGPNQLDNMRADVSISRDDLLKIPAGQRTERGLRECIRVGVQYIEAWLGGRGAVPLYNLMEDAATAEICRAQIWQWLTHGAALEDGRRVDEALFRALLDDEMRVLREALDAKRRDSGHLADAIDLFSRMVTDSECEEFLTLPAYRLLTRAGA